jgi:hypothetical protein
MDEDPVELLKRLLKEMKSFYDGMIEQKKSS